MAEHILATQEQGDLQHYDDRFASQKQVADSMAALAPRGDLPPLPAELVRGTPGSVLDPVAVHEVEVLPDSRPTPAEQVATVQAQLVEQAHVEHPEFYRQDNEPVEDPVLARLRAWRPGT